MEGVRVTHQGLKAHTPEGSAGRITQAGLAARSPEGTAAKGMAIKGHEDLWVEIQANTFRNWVNETLKPVDIKVVDLVEDLTDGTVLCALVEALQGRRLKGWSKNPTNQHHRLENCTTALQAIEDDGVKLVNIGNVDIVNGNLKLILGLIWSLIVRYQIGRSKFPPRKLMLSWLQSSLPECRVSNLTTDWNSGVLLSALLDHCKPGIFPHWKELNRHEAVENCRRAMKLAHRELQVPMVLEPEYLASPWLDELSGMTYLSYFMKPDSSGMKSTLDWVNSRLERPISNFTTDWNDGRVANELVRSMGGPAPPASKLRRDPARWEENNQMAIDAAKKLGVQPVLSAKDMSQSDVEHLGVMAWATQFRNIPPRPPVHDMLRVALDSTSGRVGEPTYIKVQSVSKDLSMSDVKVLIVNPLEQESRLKLDSRGAGEFVPEHAGMHEIVLVVDDIRVDGRYFFRVLPRLVSVPPPGMAPCAAGSLVEVLVSATGAPRRQDIDVTAHSPSGRAVPLEARHPPPSAAGTTASSATFQPDEAGTWTIAITYKGEHIQGGPFTCEVFDPAGVRLSPGALEGADALKPHSFELDTSGCGVKGDLQLDIVHDKRSVMCALEKLSPTKYRATFMPKATGKHRLYIYFNGYDVHGSPHVFRVGSKSKRLRDSASPSPYAGMSSPVTRLRSESPQIYESNSSKYGRRDDYKDTREKSFDVTDTYSRINKDKAESPLYRTTSPLRRTPNYEERDYYNTKDATDSYSRMNKEYKTDSNRTTPIRRTPNFEERDMYNSKDATDSYSRINKEYKTDHNRTTSPVQRTPTFEERDLYNTKAATDTYSRINKEYKTDHNRTTSPVQRTPTFEERDLYNTKAATDTYSRINKEYKTDHNRTTSPVQRTPTFEERDLYNTKAATDTYSRINKEYKTDHNRTTSPVQRTPTFEERDYYNTKDATDTYSRINKEYKTDHHRTTSPVQRTSSPIRRATSPSHRTSSPITSKYLGSRLDSAHRATSPFATSLTRDSPLKPTSPINRVSSPTERYSPVTTTKRVVEKRSNYKMYSSYSGSQDNIDHSPLSSLENERSRRYGSPGGDGNEADPGGKNSWDSVERTRQMLTKNSLDTDRHGQSTLERETQRNTQLNKFSDLSHDAFNQQLDRLADERESDTYTHKEFKREVRESSYVVRDSSFSSMEEKRQEQQSFLSNRPPRDPTGGANSETDAAHVRFRPIQRDNRGAKGIVIKPSYKGVLGQPVEFIVDASGAGPGQLELEVSGGNGSLVASSVRSLGGNRYNAAFTPTVLRPHIVRVTFNNEHVPGSPWEVDVMAGPVGGGGEPTRLIPARVPAVFEISTAHGDNTFTKNEVGVTVTAPSRRLVTSRVLDVAERPGVFRIEFTPDEVGTHLIDVSIGDEKLAAGPLIAKVYDASLIKVTDVGNALVGQQSQFRVDASAAGEGQLEISINEGEVPNHVQVVGGGRCLVFWRPETPTPHRVDIKFNGEPVPSSPFVFHVAPAQRVTIDTTQIELIPVGELVSCSVRVEGSGGGELNVTVKGPRGEVPVRLTGDVVSGLVASFTAKNVGPHTLTAHYNNQAVPGTPFICKAYDSKLVSVTGGTLARMGVPVQLAVDAAQAGEGNLEITVAARGLNIPTQVHPQGNARFTVSFTPTEACEHVVNVSFNKMRVPGCPLVIDVSEGGVSGARVTIPGPVPLHQPTFLTLHHSTATLEQIEVNVEGPNGASVPAAVSAAGAGTFRAEFVPRAVGEHRLNVLVDSQPIPASPFHLKVYDVTAIRVKDVAHGTVGKPVTFLVETMAAGPGNLEVTVNGGRVPTAAAAQGAHTYAISFTPRDPRPHTVELRFNGDHVPGSPFVCHVSAPARVIGAGSGESPDKVSVGDAYTFSVDSPASPHVEVLGPARRPVPVQVSADDTIGENEASKRYTVSFVPVDVGDHSIEVRAGAMGGHVEGSPFLVKAYSAARVSVTDISPGTVGRPISFTINASHAGAGNLEIIVAVAGRNVPNFVQSEGNARFKVNFKPTEAAPHTLSVRFNGHAVPGSPFTCIVSAPANAPDARASGPGLTSAARGENTEINLTGFHSCEPTVSLTGPGGANVRTNVNSMGEGRYTCTYTPEVVGRHSVHVQCGGRHVPGSPFVCNVYDVRRVRVTGLGPGELEGTLEGLNLDESGEEERGVEVGKPVTFSVDAAGAGEGTLELVVSTPSTTVKAEVVAVARGLYDVTFVPVSREPHRVSVTFNEQAVPGSPFICRVNEPHTYVQIGTTATIEIDENLTDVEVLSPTGTRVADVFEDEGIVTFPVSRIGRYVIRSPRGSVAEVEALDPSAVKVLSIGEALAHRPAIITVSTSSAGSGRLSARVTSCGRTVPHSVRRRGGSRTELVWHPARAAPHRITLLWSGIPIAREALMVDVMPGHHGQEVSASGLGLYHGQVSRVSSFSIDTLGRAAREFDVVVSGPGTRALPVRCYQTKSGLLQAEFTITEVGQSTIEVLHLSKPITGSPYTCESFDPNKVILSGLPTGNLIAHTPINFTVDTKDAGVGELDVLCEAMGKRRVRLPVDIREDGTLYKVRLRPTMPAHYRIYVTYGGASVPGSPMSLGVLSSRASIAAKCSGTGLAHAHVGKEAAFTIHCVDDTPPTVQVERLEGKEDETDSGLLECRVTAGAPREWLCAYIPLVVGQYEVRIFLPSGPLPGSPFSVKVIDTSAIVAVGGWGTDNSGRVRAPSKLVLDTSNAGPGTLECLLAGRHQRVETVSGRAVVTLTAPEGVSGEQELELTYNGALVSGAPRRALVASGNTADRVTLAGRGLAHAAPHTPAVFTIDGSAAGLGSPEASLNSPDGESVPVALTAAGPGLWRATYTPRRAGDHHLRVLWAGRLVKGCPLTVKVSAGSESGDASKVVCSGAGLTGGVVGRDIRSWIDTRRAGPGELTAHCSGPNKVAYCELYEHGDGTFTLNVKPAEAGKHVLSVQFAGEHVPGSPFTLKVAGAPDPSKVRVYGPGIEAGVLATFQSRFICDTRGAGAGQLTVRVRGPKGAFRVEMQRENQKDRTILCKFSPTEPGDYRVEVRWAGRHVPGSPFPVMIFDTQEELRRYLQATAA
ncbi:filamin-A isoform X1 [Pieris napi]|uniref:filamin-A isoform X1 n=1 Tax=Pieris napi TaxID=78633 RepID=UPI001FB8AC83|nr:filamin-A isoform X1 [Pieris napi]